MSLFLRGNVWYMELRRPGEAKPFRESTHTADRALAEKIERSRKAELLMDAAKLRAPTAIHSTKTWADAAERWLLDRAKKRDITGDRQKLAWLAPHLGEKLLASITRGVVVDTVCKKIAEGASHSTANRYLSLISAILNRAETVWEWIDAAPNLRRTKFDEPEGRERWLTVEEIGRLLAELPMHQRRIAAFAFAVGLRQSNIIGLTWDRVLLDKGFLYIDRRSAKGKKAINVPLNEVALAILESCKGDHDRYVFCYRGPYGNQKPRPVKAVNTEAFKKAMARAGITDFRPHDMRHTWASHQAMNGTPIDVLKELGGWSSLAMPMRYRHLSGKHLSSFAGNAPKMDLGTVQASPVQPVTARTSQEQHRPGLPATPTHQP